MSKRQGQGRHASIPREAHAATLKLHTDGHGYQKIARLLEDLGVFTTKSSVFRLLKGLPPYGSGD